ncbi:sensor histidine kinase [Planomonospora venezuelensis]|uniref:histidine kinase n=1 Tax=Planomonospora venezuelensis TaxID=1999 RepID=A0A841DI50_PLAVE|nr:HAMP domain-containing sensor histidine kinase [Planomonospora venezuelensis]MBB5967765.1 two-component system OmpR family sensor kinase [Planomonospora venezuelensis]GIM62301.1 two-component sensor histidine kinase [Planomonospora venezuelensis]
MSSDPLTKTPPGAAAGAPAGRRTGPRRWRGWSLRARLVAAMLALLTLAFLAVGVTTEVTLAEVLYGRVDAQLAAAAGRAPHGYGPPPAQEPDGRAPDTSGPTGCAQPQDRDFPRGQAIGTLSARICAGEVVSADVLVEQGQAQPEVGASHATLLTVPVDAAPATYDLGELGDYRLVARPLPDGAVLVTGLPLAETQETLYLVAAVVAGVTALVLLAAGYAGTVIVRRTLRPLSRVAATAARVSQLTLHRGEVELPQRVAEADADTRTEVGQVGAALNRMLDHVGSALEARHASETQVRQFVADASHELRTPLAAICGYAELSRRGRQPVPDEVAHVLRRVEAEARRMTVLVEDMLLLARLDAGRPLACEPVDLTMLTVDAVSDAHAAGPRHDWHLDVPEEPITVAGDAARLQQVLANLLANARSHTPEGTRVTVGVEARGGHAVLTVTDTGPGIPPELLPHVFERFARGDTSRSRAAGSTGLGLAIVHAVVTAHGGSVEACSVPGRTSFTVRLPRAADDGA